jgi:hypothetical protein
MLRETRSRAPSLPGPDLSELFVRVSWRQTRPVAVCLRAMRRAQSTLASMASMASMASAVEPLIREWVRCSPGRGGNDEYDWRRRQ